MPSEDTRIRIVQCLCPSRHCIAAIAYDPADRDDEAAIAGLRDMLGESIASGVLNPWCALCLSRQWHYEVGVTRFHSLEEARPHLMTAQAEQLLTQLRLTAVRQGDA